MIVRSSNAAASMIRLNDLGRASQRLDAASQQITTGKVITKMSDNPGDAVRSLAQRAELRRVDQLARNLTDAQAWLEQADGALIDASEQLNSVRSLLVRATNGGLGTAERAAIAAEVDSIREAMLQSANTTRMGRPIFNGTDAGSVAFDATGQYLGDGGAVVRTIEASDGAAPVVVNRTGPQVFGQYNAADPANGNVFQLLEHLSAALVAGDNAAINAGINLVVSAADRVGVATVELGSRASQLEASQSQLDDARYALRNGISKLEDTDLAEATINFKTREVAYNAALQVTASVSRLSLMDFLR